MFFYEVEGHMPKLSSFGRGKIIRPKKSLTSFLHAALQLFFNELKINKLCQSYLRLTKSIIKMHFLFNGL